jgi:hypothetical protein
MTEPSCGITTPQAKGVVELQHIKTYKSFRIKMLAMVNPSLLQCVMVREEQLFAV